MEVKQNPFSFYDFLGYFFPGSLVIYFQLFSLIHAGVIQTETLKAEFAIDFKGFDFYLPFVLISYLTGHFVNYLSSITIEKYSNWMYGYPSKNLLGYERTDYFNTEKQQVQRGFLRAFVLLLLAPITIIDYILSYRLRLDELFIKPLDPLLKSIITKRVIELLSEHAGLSKPAEGSTPKNSDFFRYMYHYAVENAPNHVAKMQNYVALYGLLRTISLCCVVFFWISLWHLSLSHASPVFSLVILTIEAGISYIFFMGFMKFYRRFTLEAMMAASVTYKSPSSTEGKVSASAPS